MSQTLITSRDPKGLHAVGLFEAVYNRSKLDEECAQRLNERGGELQDGIAKLIRKLSVVSGQFAHEEMQSIYRYPKGYKAKSVTEQTNILRQLFPGVGNALEKLADQPLPPYAEGWFAIPKWEKFGKTYGEAVEVVLAKLAATRTFRNHRDGKFGAEYLRQSEKTKKSFSELAERQKGYDILVVPAQFGMRHRGRSIRWASEVFASDEFGLGAFAVGIMVLTHPERLIRWEQLHVGCPGDECSVLSNGSFSFAPFFDSYGDGVRFFLIPVNYPDSYSGCASGFLSRQ